MIELSEAAVEAVVEYFRTMESRPIRIFVSQGCGGAQLAMALDEAGDSDVIHRVRGFQFIIDRDLLDQVQPVNIDYSEMGFRISSSLQPSGGCRTCGTAGSCCGA